MASDDGGFTALHVDGALLVLDKPAGLLSVPGRGADKQDCLSARVQAIYPDALVVHRLDMATSGVMLMARGTVVQKVLGEAFAQRAVHKRYEAIVHGDLPPAQATDGWGSIDLPIAVDWPNRPKRVICHEGGKASLTRWCVHGISPLARTTRLALEPVTGRSHQLRVHLRAIGHPIVGDALYASDGAAPTPSGTAPTASPAPRLMLHACSIRFIHPLTGTPVQFDRAPDF